MNSGSSFRAYAALLFAMLVWGLSFLAIKDAIDIVPIFSLLFIRFLLAAVFLGLWVGRQRSVRLPKRDLLGLAGISLLSPIGYFLFETFGIAHTQPSHVSVIIATIPLAVFLIAFLRRQEQPTWKKTLGILTAYAGVLSLIGLGRRDVGASLFGDLLIFGAVLCAAFRTSLIKDVLKRVTPLQLTFYQFFFSLFVFAPLAATDGAGWMSRLTALSVLEILFLGIFCSAGAFLAMHYALTHLAATQVAVSANLIPAITLFAEAMLFRAPLTSAKLVGTGLVIGGVLLTQRTHATRRPTSLGVPERGG